MTHGTVEKRREYARNYALKFPEKLRAYKKQWKLKRRDVYLAQRKRYEARQKLNPSPEVKLTKRIASYKSGAKKRGLEFQLSREQVSQYFQGTCFYCGGIEKMGIDRKDNQQGYTVKNCVSCCYTCNVFKRALSMDSFISKCLSITQHISGEKAGMELKELVQNITNGSLRAGREY